MNKRLRESEEYKLNEAKRAHLAAIVEHSNDAIFSKSLDGIITSWNAGAEKMYGYSAEEAIGKPVSIIIPQDYQEEMEGIIDKVRSNEAVQNIETIRKRRDGTLFSISLTVLIRNAWKFTSKTENPIIEISSKDEKGQRIFFVKDNWAGFDSEKKDNLFEPFKRLHSDNEFPGTGIGLAIVKRVIRKHGGKIWAESLKGKGATFYFTLD